jgi:hypothetical protein
MQAARAISPPWAGSPLGTYLTDGRRLLRIVSLPDRSRGWRTAVLEDCRTLELRHFRRRDLRRLRQVGSRPGAWRRVVAAAPAAADIALDQEASPSTTANEWSAVHANGRP